MNRARPSRRSLPWAISLVAAVGCSALQPHTITGVKAQAVRDTVIALENATDLAVDRLDCPAAFEHIGDEEPIFVSSGRVFRTRAAFRGACDTMIAPRTGAVFATDTVSAQVLSPDAAFVVREGVYTVNFKDGSSRRSYVIVTSVWARQDAAWKMVHLHESSRALAP